MSLVQRAIERLEAALAQKQLPPECLAQLHKGLDMPLEDFIRLQELKSLAVTEGTLSLADGQHIYAILGQTPDHFNQQPLAQKAVVTKIFSELLELELRRH